MNVLSYVSFLFHRARRASPMCTNSWFDPLHFGLALCSFIESLWEEGDSKNEAIDCVSGMLHYLPQLKGKVPGSKRLLVAWSKCQLPARASPLNTFFLAALAGKAVALNDRPLWNGIPAASLCCTKPNLDNVPPPVKRWSFSMLTWYTC